MSETISNCPQCGAPIPPEAPQGLCPKCLLAQASIPTEAGPATGRSRPVPPSRDALAAAFPNLEILELIGQGGMGFVYKARQPKLDRVVALKILAQPVSGELNFAERFTREGRLLAKLNHPNIVTIHDFGVAGPFYYLLMEYVDGVNLRQAMKAGSVAPDQALAIVPKICEALQYAHNEGVLHRDIKPDNILLDARGRVKIADFGIAKLMAENAAENSLTGSGSTLGTPHYMAPEQIEKPNSVDHRADIYSLGVVFYEMLTGELPLGRFAAPSETKNVDPRLDRVVFQTLEKQPERRPQSADELRTRVEDIATHPGKTSEAPVTFKMARCYISTPEFLQSWIGRLFRFTGRGELRLDENQLTFAPRGNWIVMPLRAITGLTVANFPGWRGPNYSLKFIAVTFIEKGTTHRFFLIPNHGGFRSFWKTNEDVEEWFHAIRHAIKAKTGIVPPSSPNDGKPLPGATSPISAKVAFGKAAFIVGSVAVFFAVGLWLRNALFTPHPPNRAAEIPRFVQRQPELMRPSDQARPSNAVAAPLPTGPSRPMTFTEVRRARQKVSLETKFDLSVTDRIVPMVRYGNGPWSSAPEVTAQTWKFVQDTSGAESFLIYSWQVPESFSADYDLAAAIWRARELINRPFFIYRDTVQPLLLVTNAAGQTFSAALQYWPSARPTVPPDISVRMRCDRASGAQGEFGSLSVDASVRLLPGTFIQPSMEVTGDPLGRMEATMDPETTRLTIRWSAGNWSDRLWSESQTLRGRIFTLPLNTRVEIFNVRMEANPAGGIPQERTMRGFLELKKLPDRMDEHE